MRRAVFTLLLFHAAAAAAQIQISAESMSTPLRPHRSALPYATPAVSMAKDRIGVAIAWSMPDANGVERVYVTRLDESRDVAGTVREISAMQPQADALAPSLAANPTGLGFTLAWAEAAELMYCSLDAALTPSAPVALTPTSAPPLARSGPNSTSVWIAAGPGLWRIGPDGVQHLFPGLAPADMAVGTDVPQLVGSRLTKILIPGACSCPVAPGGPFRGVCPFGCEVYSGTYTIDVVALSTAAASRTFRSLSDAQPAIASDADNVTVAWFEGDEASGGSVMAVRVPLSALASLTAARALTLGSFAPDAGVTRPAIASDGERALVVWRVQKSPGDHDVAAAVVDSDGTVTPLTIAASAADERDPSVIAIGHGAFLVAYEKIDAGERRIAGRVVTFGRQRAVR